MLTMKVKYALSALGILAREYGKGPLLASTISAQQNIPEEFLRLILLQLKNKGLIESKKGKGGGYLLARQPAAISVGQLIRALDGPMLLLPCTASEVTEPCTACFEGEACVTRMLFRQAAEATASVLDNATLADIARPSRIAATGRQL